MRKGVRDYLEHEAIALNCICRILARPKKRRSRKMSMLDIGFMTCAVVAILTLIITSPWHRAVFLECLFHPRSDGWLDYENGRVEIHRGASLSDHILSQTIVALEQAETALEAASRKIQTISTMPSDRSMEEAASASSWYAAIAASVAAVAAGAAGYLLRGDSSEKREGA